MASTGVAFSVHVVEVGPSMVSGGQETRVDANVLAVRTSRWPWKARLGRGWEGAGIVHHRNCLSCVGADCHVGLAIPFMGV